MSTTATGAALTSVGDGVWAWIHPFTDRVASNAAVVLDDDGLTVVDSDGLARHHQALAAAVAGLGHPVRRLVLTHSHLDHVAGAGAIGAERTLATARTIAALDTPPTIAAMQAMNPDIAGELAGLTHPDGLEEIDGTGQLTPRIRLIECAGHSTSDLVLAIDDAGITIAADMGFFGTVPVGIQGDFDAWADSLVRVAELGPTFVPGHGPIGGAADVEGVASYIDAIREASDAAAMGAGPWDAWRDPFAAMAPGALTQINIERHQINRSEQAGFPPTLMKLLTPA